MHIFVCVLWVYVCQQWRCFTSLLDIHTMASLCVLSSAGITACLSRRCFLVFSCVCANVHCYLKKVPLCSNSTPSSVMLQGRRQDGANRGWYVHRQGEGFAETYANKREVAANGACCCDCHRLMTCLKCADFEGGGKHISLVGWQ